MLNLRKYFQQNKSPDSNVPDREIARSLAQHWAGQTQLQVQEPVRLGEILQFERTHGVRLPDDLKDCLERVNGFSPYTGDQDDRGFRFLPLDEFQPVAVFDGGQFHFEGDQGFFIFCDYLHFCWAYAICLTPHHPSARVVIAGTKDGIAQPVADSFSEFAELYLRDDERLYPAA